MKKIIYIYLLETMASWEISYILQGISMQKEINKKEDYQVITFSKNNNPINTLDGLTITPHSTIKEIDKNNAVALLIPGAKSFDNHQDVFQLATEFLQDGVLVGGICGATLEFAKLGLLDNYEHTSNALEYLNYFAPNYKGQDLYRNSPSCLNNNLATASSAGGLLWARDIFQYLGVYSAEKLELWHKYFALGNPQDYLALIS